MSFKISDPWLTIAEICEYLAISDDTLYRLIRNKNFPAKKIGNRWKAKKIDIDKWIADNNSTTKKREE